MALPGDGGFSEGVHRRDAMGLRRSGLERGTAVGVLVMYKIQFELLCRPAAGNNSK